TGRHAMSPLFRRRAAEEAPDLRAQILHADPTMLGFSPHLDRPVWGAVMDMAFPDGVASLISLEDGTTSLYTSTGGGVIGGGAHQPVVDATEAFIQAVSEHVSRFSPTEIGRAHV